MRLREYGVSPQLRPFVRSLWGLESDAVAACAPPMRIVPDGVVELVLHYRTPFAMRFAGAEFSTQPNSFAVAQARRYLEIRARGASGFVAVRFEPWGAQQFLPTPIRELADGFATTHDLWGSEGAALEEGVALARSEGERVALIESFLVSQLRRHEKLDLQPLVREVWRRRGQVGVASLCADVGIGERRLERSFSRAIGLPPKSYAKLCRFLYSCRSLTESGLRVCDKVTQARRTVVRCRPARRRRLQLGRPRRAIRSASSRGR